MILIVLIPTLILALVLIWSTSLSVENAAAQVGEKAPLDEVITKESGYQLTRLTWQVRGEATGGGYALSSPSASDLRGNGCCCTYIPCLLNKK